MAPTYVYLCGACAHRYEKFQSITAKPDRKCPECGRSSVRRVIQGGAGLIFKGSGFYTTDYRSKNYQESAKKESPEKKESKEKKETPAAKKPQEKPKKD